jgi:O-antigen/teichoic acid export membrane protein
MALLIAENIQIALLTVPMQTFAGQTADAARRRFAGTMALHAVVLAAGLALLIYLGARASAAVVPSWRLADIALPLALLVLAGQTAEAGRRYFYAFGPPMMSFVVNAVRYGGQFIGLLALMAFASPGVGLGAALAAMIGAAVAALAVAIPRLDIGWPSRAEFAATTIAHWIYGRWLLLANLVSAGREGIVAAVIGASLGLAEIGVFRAAQQLVNLVNIPAFAMHNVVTTPMGAAYGRSGVTGVLAYARAYMAKYLVALLACLALIAGAGSWLLETLYGKAFAGYGLIVALMAASVALYMVRDACNLVLRTVDRTDLPFLAVLGGALASVVLVYPLVTYGGLAGAVIGEIVFGVVALGIAAGGLRRICAPVADTGSSPRNTAKEATR